MMNDHGKDTIILVTDSGMGHADPALQHDLFKKYLSLLNEFDLLPAIICFYTDGVKMLIEGSPVLEALRSLEEKGVHLIACGTCLDFLGVRDRLEVGIIGGMTDIIEAQWQARKVITLS